MAAPTTTHAAQALPLTPALQLLQGGGCQRSIQPCCLGDVPRQPQVTSKPASTAPSPHMTAAAAVVLLESISLLLWLNDATEADDDCLPSTFCVLVARIMISVRMGVTRTSTPE